MVVMDMDDTLLRDDHTISKKNKMMIKEAQESGVKVVLASGRPTFAMRDYAKELELDKYSSYMLSYNGAVITDCKEDEAIFQKSLSKETAHELYELSKEHNVFIHTYLNDDIILEENNEYTDIEHNITGMDVKVVENFKEIVQEDVIKVLMLEEPTYLKEVAEKLKPLVLDKMNMTISKPFFLEFMDKGIDKSTSLERLINKLGIKQEEVIAIGDSYNDLGMIKYAGLGICVENAPDDMKIHADFITESCMDDGVAKVIEKFVLKK